MSAWGGVADRVFPQSIVLPDPATWIEQRLGGHIWSKSREVCDSVRDHQYTAVQAAHDVSKSWTAARLVCWWLEGHPPGTAFVISTAPTFSQVRAILWREIGRAHRDGKLRGRVNQTEWWLDDELVGMGRKPADHDQQGFQGIHAENILVVIDEAGGVPANLWVAIDSITTNENAKVLAIGNPDIPGTPFQKACTAGSEYNVIKISAFDTPAYTGEVVPDRVMRALVSKKWVESRKKKWGVDSPVYQSKVLAEFPEQRDDALFPVTWVDRAARRDIEKPAVRPTLGVDVARYGSARSIVISRWGAVARTVGEFSHQSTMKTTGHVVKLMRELDAVKAQVDSAGVGGGVVDRLEELDVNVQGINVGEGSSEPDAYVNLRAELFWSLRKRFENDDIDIELLDDDLISELTSMRWNVDSKGRILIESKDQMAKRGLPSPDKADALMLAFAETGWEPPPLAIPAATQSSNWRD